MENKYKQGDKKLLTFTKFIESSGTMEVEGGREGKRGYWLLSRMFQ